MAFCPNAPTNNFCDAASKGLAEATVSAVTVENCPRVVAEYREAGTAPQHINCVVKLMKFAQEAQNA